MQMQLSWLRLVDVEKAPDPMVFYSETINYAWFHLVLLYGLRLYVFYLPPIDGEEWDGNELQPRQRYFLVVVVVCRIYDHFERMNYFGARLRWRIYAVAVALLTTSAPRALAYLFNNSRWRRRRALLSLFLLELLPPPLCTINVGARAHRNPCNYRENLSRQKFARSL